MNRAQALGTATGTGVRQSWPVSSLLGVLFVALKLTGYIDWSWWWVTAPFWGPFGLIVGLMLLVGIVAGVTILGAATIDFLAAKAAPPWRRR